MSAEISLERTYEVLFKCHLTHCKQSEVRLENLVKHQRNNMPSEAR